MTRSKYFQVRDFYDIEIIPSVAYKLGCSQATMYRTLTRAEIPIYYLPSSPSSVILHAASLWRLASTPAFRKYIQREKIPSHAYNEFQNSIHDNELIPVVEAVKSGLLPLSEKAAFQAANCGLVPHSNYKLQPWFVLVLTGEIEFQFPRKY